MTIWADICQFSETEQSKDYIVSRQKPEDGVPLPPLELRLYGESDDDHLAGGSKAHSQIMNGFAAIRHTGQIGRLLEFGCSNGRVLRHFLPMAAKDGTELWGVDSDARRTLWAHHAFGNLANIAVTTPQPHLPFKDGYFDLVYAISIFTHIDLTFMSWFAEIARITAAGGFAWLTIHDEVTATAMAADESKYFVQRIKTETKFLEYAARPFDWFAVGAGVMRNVFFRRQWLIERLDPLFRLRGAFEKTTGGVQTALLLERK